MKSSFKWQWWLVVLGLTLIVAGALCVKSLVDRLQLRRGHARRVMNVLCPPASAHLRRKHPLGRHLQVDSEKQRNKLNENKLQLNRRQTSVKRTSLPPTSTPIQSPKLKKK